MTVVGENRDIEARRTLLRYVYGGLLLCTLFTSTAESTIIGLQLTDPRTVGNFNRTHGRG